MQNDDGGWAAFDRTRHREWMEHDSDLNSLRSDKRFKSLLERV